MAQNKLDATEITAQMWARFPCMLTAGSSFALILKQKNIGNEDIPLIANYLKLHPEIIKLDVSFNQIGDEGAAILAGITTLSNLKIYLNEIGSVGAEKLAASTSISKLNIRNNPIKAAGGAALIQNLYFTKLNMESCKIGDEVVKCLPKNTKLTHLRIAGNQIGSEGAKVLALAPTLVFLDICGNNIGDEGAKALASNTNFSYLNIEDNHLTFDGMQAFVDNTTLLRFKVVYNYVKELCQEHRPLMLHVPRALESLVISEEEKPYLELRSYFFNLTQSNQSFQSNCKENIGLWTGLKPVMSILWEYLQNVPLSASEQALREQQFMSILQSKKSMEFQRYQLLFEVLQCIYYALCRDQKVKARTFSDIADMQNPARGNRDVYAAKCLSIYASLQVPHHHPNNFFNRKMQLCEQLYQVSPEKPGFFSGTINYQQKQKRKQAILESLDKMPDDTALQNAG